MEISRRHILLFILCILAVTLYTLNVLNSSAKATEVTRLKLNVDIRANYSEVEPPTAVKDDTMAKSKLILAWFPFFSSPDLPGMDDAPTTCKYKCEYTHSRSRLHEADAVVFHSRNLKFNDMPQQRRLHQKWVFAHWESPPYIGVSDWNTWNGVQFNWTMSYETTSDILAPYGAVRFRRRNSTDERPKPPDFSNRKADAVWIVSNCSPPSRRKEVVGALRKMNVTVDIYGGCGTLGRPPTPDKAFYEQYKFYLAFENNICTDYITEKFWKILESQAATIPITYNGGDATNQLIPDYKVINALHFEGPFALGAYLKNLTNKDLTNFFQWQQEYEAVYSNGWVEGECNLCEKLHSMEYTANSEIKNLKDRVSTDKCTVPNEYLKHKGRT